MIDKSAPNLKLNKFILMKISNKICINGRPRKDRSPSAPSLLYENLYGSGLACATYPMLFFKKNQLKLWSLKQ